MESKEISSFLILIIIGFVLGFVFGSSYNEGRMKKIIAYCADEYSVKNEILDCIQYAINDAKGDPETKW